MRRSGQCPKCQSKDLIRIPGQVGAYGSGNNIMVGWMTYSAVKVTRFVCVGCGFSEEWIESSEDRAKLYEKFGADKRG
jgi:hypothetical protein